MNHIINSSMRNCTTYIISVNFSVGIHAWEVIILGEGQFVAWEFIQIYADLRLFCVITFLSLRRLAAILL